MSIILNEKKYVEDILNSKDIGSKPSATLFLLGKYYRKVMGYDVNETFNKLNEFMQKYYPNYNPVLWENIIDDISKKSNKYNIREVDSIGITQLELDTIALLKDKTLEKLVFVMLCHSKLYNLSSANNNNWINTKLPEIFKTARVNVKFKDDKMFLINKLLNAKVLEFIDEDGVIINSPLISISKKNTNKNIQLLFIDNNNKPILSVNDFRELGYEYMLYLGENYSRCEKCGILFKQNKNKSYKYCIKHRGYQPLETKTIKCIDPNCDVEFEVDAKDNETCRCEFHRKEHIKELRKQQNKRYYENKKEIK